MCGSGTELDTLVMGYTNGMNYVSGIVYENGKPMGSGKIQKRVYTDLRQQFDLKSQMACNICRQVAGTYKTLQEQIKIEQTEWQKIEFKPSNVTFSFQRDYTITPEEISITTLEGRKRYPIVMYDHARQYFDGSWTFSASKLVKHKDGYYFHLCCEKEVETKPILETPTFMGIDVGMNWLAVGSTTDKKCKFFGNGGVTKHIRSTYKGMRKRLQAKGTLSAARVLKRMADKERRLMANLNHIISKDIVKFAVQNGVTCIGVEDLTGLRESTVMKCKKERRYHKSSWSYFQLQNYIEYKAAEAGIVTVDVNPEYTSQTCSRCNHIQKTNRQGRWYRCGCCGFTLHADLNAARNIEQKLRTSRYISEVQGCLSATQTDATKTIQAPCESGG
jgi:IS605 OrfB family transposase